MDPRPHLKRPLAAAPRPLFGVALAFLLVLATCGSSVAEASSALALPGRDYVIRPGDLLEIVVWGHEDLSSLVTVREDGKISFNSILEEVAASGLTVPDLREVLTSKLSHYLKDPKVTVSLRQAQTLQVNVIGFVGSPGVFSFRGQPTLMDAIASAGGNAPDADMTCIRIIRRGVPEAEWKESLEAGAVTVDLSDVLAGRTDPMSCVLSDGDTVYVPRALVVQVMGMVRAPGTYFLERGSRLVDAVARAGDVTPDGDPTRVTISSGGVVRMANLHSAMLAPGGDANVLLKDGDVIHVQEAVRTISVLGEVQRPGVYPIGPETRVFDAIAASGGLGTYADASCIRVTRPSAHEDLTVEIDLDQVGGGWDAPDAPARRPDGTFRLAAGDIVYVPRAIEVQVFGQVQSPGSHRLRTGSGLVDAVAKAGGTLDSADTARVRLTRTSGETSGVRIFDLDAVLEGSVSPHDLTLKDQDIIVVPELVREVSVLGAVNRPGTYRVHKNTRVLDALALAGGVTPEGDATHAVLSGSSGSADGRRVIDLDRLQAAGGGEENCLVRNGDVLYVPRAITVMILGAVKAPGAYMLRATSRLMDAISRAGGIAADGDSTRATLTRHSGDVSVETVDMEAIMAGAIEQNVQLHDGDIIFVPETIREVSIFGEVARPGVYTIRERTSLLEALALAGGITQMGDAGTVRLTRRRPDESLMMVEFNLDQPSQTPDPGAWILGSGDVIYVPRAIAVQVVGEVMRPGLYYLREGSAVSDALALAGGLSDDADSSCVTLTTRDGRAGEPGKASSVQFIDVTAIFTGADLSANALLSDRDTIFVPKAEREVVVVGEVQRPGLYKIRKDARLMDAVALAGGPTKRAALEAVCVFRKGQISAGEEITLGQDNLFFTGKAEANPPVIGGDIIYLPVTSKIEWEKVFSFLSGLNLIKTLLTK